MTEPVALSILRRKKQSIEATIALYEKKIDEARLDLAAVSATIRLFEVNGTTGDPHAYFDVNRLFRRGETTRVCRAALAQEGPLDTRELALRLIRHKKFDESDTVLVKSITYRIVHTLRSAERRGTIIRAGKNGLRLLWVLGSRD
jgi:hypothetical protein